MSRFSGQVDLTWGGSGDFVFDPNTQDFEDTKLLPGRNLAQRIETRLTSAAGDWDFMDLAAAASLKRALGRLNNRTTATSIENSIRNALAYGGFLQPGEFEVAVAPASRESMLVMLRVTPLGQRQAIFQAYTMNLKHNQLLRNV